MIKFIGSVVLAPLVFALLFWLTWNHFISAPPLAWLSVLWATLGASSLGWLLQLGGWIVKRQQAETAREETAGRVADILRNYPRR